MHISDAYLWPSNEPRTFTAHQSTANRIYNDIPRQWRSAHVHSTHQWHFQARNRCSSSASLMPLNLLFVACSNSIICWRDYVCDSWSIFEFLSLRSEKNMVSLIRSCSWISYVFDHGDNCTWLGFVQNANESFDVQKMELKVEIVKFLGAAEFTWFLS
jgi:transposase-like protein